MSALSGAAIATPAADPAQQARPAAGAGEQVMRCYGVDTCKGTSDCAIAHNECKGQKECKGQGSRAMTMRACNAAGGMTTAPAAQ